jgi:predicted RNA-binding protein YlqC (UPF0109 family)
MKNTELEIINTIAEALMGYPINLQYHATGQYVDATRRITIDVGSTDVGPLIGHAGSMKLAIQSIIACPFGGDNCQLVIKTTRENRIERYTAPETLEPRLERFLRAIQDHYPAGALTFRLERSPSAVIVFIESRGLFLDNIRGAVAKTIRAIGRRHSTVAVVSIESTATA